MPYIPVPLRPELKRVKQRYTSDCDTTLYIPFPNSWLGRIHVVFLPQTYLTLIDNPYSSEDEEQSL